MNEPKNFLTRWSERKLKPEDETPAHDGNASTQPVPEAAAKGPSNAEPEFDISTLPSLESITARSDIRAFLQSGVPAELTRAALRRAWSADPAIRDFVGLSENSWDFNAPDSIPGFASSLSTEQLKQTAAQLLDEFAKETDGRSLPESAGESVRIQAEGGQTSKSVSEADLSAPSEPRGDAAMQREEAAALINSPRQTRRHGGALPE